MPNPEMILVSQQVYDGLCEYVKDAAGNASVLLPISALNDLVSKRQHEQELDEESHKRIQLEAENAELRAQLEALWVQYHAERCGEKWPHGGVCLCPPPELLAFRFVTTMGGSDA